MALDVSTMSLRSGAFLEAIIAALLPYFTASAADIQDARDQIMETLASYATCTRRELLMAATNIAAGMTTLDVLREAKTEDMSVSMRLRHRGNACNLNRAILQIEQAFDQRLAVDAPDLSETASLAETTPDEVAATDAAVIAQVNEARAELAAHNARPDATHVPTNEERNLQLTALDLIDGRKPIGISIQIIPGATGSAALPA